MRYAEDEDFQYQQYQPIQGRFAGDQLAEQITNTNDKIFNARERYRSEENAWGEKRAENLKGLIEKPIEKYYQAKDRNKAEEMHTEQMRSMRNRNDLDEKYGAEERSAGLEQTRTATAGAKTQNELSANTLERDKKYGDQKAGLEVAQMEKNNELLDYQNKLTGLQADAAKADAAWANALAADNGAADAKPNETMRSYLARKDLEFKQLSAELQREALEGQKENRDIARKKLPLEMEALAATVANAQTNGRIANLNLTEQERTTRVRDYAASLANETSPERAWHLAQQMIASGAKPAEIASALQENKSKAMQSEIIKKQVAMLLSPQEQFVLNKTLEGQDKHMQFKQLLADMNQDLTRFDDAFMGTEKAQGALERFKASAKAMGFEKEAEDLDSILDVTADKRATRMTEIVNAIRLKAAAQVRLYKSYDPKFEAMAQEYGQQIYNGGNGKGYAGGNPFMNGLSGPMSAGQPTQPGQVQFQVPNSAKPVGAGVGKK